MDLEENELGWLANHLAHDVKTHKKFYRQHDASLELAKISKLLIATEYGTIHTFAGKNLQDINLDGNYITERSIMVLTSRPRPRVGP